ncbi:MAG: hypothetical protein ABI696_03890 [Rubrivivax sp.]
MSGATPASPAAVSARAARRRWCWRGAAAAALALVFAAYLNPHVAVDLANAVWACF